VVKPSYRIRLLISGLLLAFAAYVSVTGMVDWYENRPPTIQEAFPTGTMVIGIDPTFPPFAVDNGQEIYGIDIDLANELADRMGVNVRFVPMGFDGLYDSLIDGQVDVVISALLLNPARTQDVRYTQPYFDNGLVLIADTANIQAMSDLPGNSLALEYGSNAHSESNTWIQRLEPFDLMPYELPQYALDAVRLDDADSALVDTTTYLLYQSQHPEWESQSNRVTNAYYAIAVRYDREAAWIWVNATLGGIIGDGTMQEIIERWFNQSSNNNTSDDSSSCFPLDCWNNIEPGIMPLEVAREEITAIFHSENVISNTVFSMEFQYEGNIMALSATDGIVTRIHVNIPEGTLQLSELIERYGEPEKVYGVLTSCARTIVFPDEGLIVYLNDYDDLEQIIDTGESISTIEFMAIEQTQNWTMDDSWQMDWNGYGRYCQTASIDETATPDR